MKDGNHYVINGDKWFITGADGAAFAIIMAKDEDGHATMFLADMDTPGIEIVRAMDSLDSAFAGGHAVMRFNNVRVPASDILGEPGKGFRYAQVRLAPARLTHCMRWLGAARRAHDIATDYALKREVFGAKLIGHEGVGFMLADNEMDIRMSRLSILHTAWMLDQGERGRHGILDGEGVRVRRRSGGWSIVAFRCWAGRASPAKPWWRGSSTRCAASASTTARRRCIAGAWRNASPATERTGEPWTDFDLTGKVCIVTGAGRGIGRGMAEGLARHGATVVLSGRTRATLEEAAAAIGEQAIVVTADVSKEADVLALRDAVLERCGRIDVLVNNAGVNAIFKGIERTSLEEWQDIIDVNLTGVFLCCKHIGGAIGAGRFGHQCQFGRGPWRAAAVGAVLRVEGRGGDADQGAGAGLGRAQGAGEHAGAGLGRYRPDAWAAGARRAWQAAAGPHAVGPVRDAAGHGGRGGVPGQRCLGVHDRAEPGDRWRLGGGVAGLRSCWGRLRACAGRPALLGA